jgi:hypothetical protein
MMIEEANAYIEACELEESEDDPGEVGWSLDYGGYGSNYDGGYDSY